MSKTLSVVLTASLFNLLAFSGCRLVDQLTVPKPGTDGQTPLDDIGRAVPRLVINPFDVPAWAAVASAIATAAGGAYAGHKRAERKFNGNSRKPPQSS